MRHLLRIAAVLILSSITAFAQFPGGRSGGGSGNGRPSRTGGQRPGQPQTVNLDGNLAKGNSKITGFVIDSEETTAVEYATISMLDEETKKVVNGTMADGNGKFTFNRVAVGTYSLTISFIGYQDNTIENIEIKKGKDVDLGIIKLSLSTQVLDEVQVVATKNLIEEKVDRLVYNAENDITSRGGDGADVLRKVPLLDVDFDGNVSLRGNENVKVLINNKPSTIVASSVADALKMIPADLIKTVEVITSPSAKYDAEGTTGIINIITKKSSIQGYSLSLNTGVGIRGSNLGLNGNLKVGKMGFSLGGFGRSFYNNSNAELNQTTYGTNIFRTEQESSGRDNGLFGRYNLGLDYEISKSAYLNGSVSFGTRGISRDMLYNTDSYLNNVFSKTEERQVETINRSNNVDVNLDYIKIFAPSHEWSISTQYSQNNMINNFDADILSSSGELLSQRQNINGNVNTEITVQTDYMVPIKNNQLFEVGVKHIMREVNSDYEYLIGLNGNLEADQRNPAGFLNYDQNISAGYLSYMYSTKNKIAIKAGVRYEHTTIDANDNNVALGIPGYGNVVPSINISKSFTNGVTVKMAYNNRISRPGLRQLNPNFNTANPLNISVGNPNLKPEVSNNVELSLSKTFGRNYLNLSLFTRQTNNSILRITSPSDTLLGAVVTTYENVGVQKASGLNLFGNVSISQKWSISGGVDAYYNYVEGQVRTQDGFATINNSGVTLGGRLRSQIILNKGWGIQASGGYRGNRVSLQGSRSGRGRYSMGIRKDFNERKGTLGLGIENIFGGMTMRSNTKSELFVQESVNYIQNQNIKLTFSYKLGNMRFVADKKTRGVSNDDVKGGGDNDNGGQ